jgi:hypothetical protein
MPYSYYPTGYGYGQPYYGQPQPAQAAGQTIYWITGGEQGARAFPMGASQTAFLMDADQNVFFIKKTDESGMPLPLRIFDFSERTEGKPTQNGQIDTSVFVTRAELEERLAAFTQAAKKPIINKKTEAAQDG